MWSQPKSSHVTVSVCMYVRACVLIVRVVQVLAGLGEYRTDRPCCGSQEVLSPLAE